MQHRINKKLDWLKQLINNTTDECILWPFRLYGNKYPTVSFNGRTESAIRVLLHLLTGFDLRSPLDVMHSCDRPACMNPRHLGPGTRSQNMQDASVKGRLKRPPKTKCKRGHPLDVANTYIMPNGRRSCRTCRSAARLFFDRHASIKKELDRRIL